ncbi:hypothetical protein [Kribbella sp. NPDC051770]|uniref:hypothetical protein n=1 Tax=Kribbella sp. NPDC051770 TaxID=3155413 RepID=UPI00344773D5
MSSRAGETFDPTRAATEVLALADAPVPEAGPTTGEGDPATGEWTATTGAGFRIVPLWEGEGLTGLYDTAWSDATDTGVQHLAVLTKTLETHWGPHHVIQLHGPLLRWQMDQPVEPLFAALFSQDLYGDLHVWGPLPSGRWLATTVGHSDGDAPLVMAALVTTQPITQPEGP